MIIFIKNNQTGEVLPLVSFKSAPDGHEILEVTCGFGTGSGLKTINCSDENGDWLLDSQFPISIQVNNPIFE